jgi:hypothetical protein
MVLVVMVVGRCKSEAVRSARIWGVLDWRRWAGRQMAILRREGAVLGGLIEKQAWELEARD